MRQTALILFVCFACGQIFGQSFHKNPIKENSNPKSYPIDGTPLLQKQYQQAAEYVSSHPQEYQKDRLAKLSSWGFTVGSTHQWWTYNYVTTGYYEDASTCRKVGKHCYIFVEDSMWSGGRVDSAAVDSIENDFDNKTPADPSKGIFVMDSTAFGAPPDVDGDPKIIILICNIQDGFDGTGGYIAGFFDPMNELPTSSYPNSNHAEIYYIDANPTDLTTPSGIQLAMQTCAHEFQHMINWNYNNTKPGGELTFINEGCSKLAEVYCGYPTFDLSLYAGETNIYLFTWRTNDNTLMLNDYARAQRFFLYIWDRFGIGIFKDIVLSKQTSGTGILNDALSKDGLTLTFNNLFSDWLIANELNDTASNRLYGYAYPDLPISNGKNYYNPNTSSTDTLQNLAAEYLIFKNGSNLSATFTNSSGNSNLSVTAIEIGNNSKNVVNVPFGSPFSEPGFGTTYNTIAFVVINEDPNNSASYSYDVKGVSSSVATELKWDSAEPTGYYAWMPSDTLCVTFDAFPHGVLDSVRVALRRAGSISGGVYLFTGSEIPTPLGKLLTPITANISTTSPSYQDSVHPYPVPYQNWTSVDLTSKNIATDNPFAVAFVIPSTDPHVMVTDYASTGPYHSYTYLNSSEATPNSAGWFYIGSPDTAEIYLIRAYISFPTGVKQFVEASPAKFDLDQNFPNPFNPSTVISYRLPIISHVILKIYDVLGREVATLVNTRQTAGPHSVTFNAENLPSGVYFYHITAGNFSEARKLVLEK